MWQDSSQLRRSSLRAMGQAVAPREDADPVSGGQGGCCLASPRQRLVSFSRPSAGLALSVLGRGRSVRHTGGKA